MRVGGPGAPAAWACARRQPGRVADAVEALAVQVPDWLPIATILTVGLAACLAAANSDGMHLDEALYTYYGRHVARGDLLLVHVAPPLDKPPIFFWALGATIRVLGETLLTIRLPDLIASLGVIALTYLLASDLGGRGAGALAGTLVALSPFAALFGATVFTDPFALALALLSLVMALRGRPALAGVALALSLGAKPFTLVYLPLAVVLALRGPRDTLRRRLVELLGAFLLTAGAVLILMWVRTAVFHAPWFLATGYSDLGGIGIAPPAAWRTRAAGWLVFGGYFFSRPALWVVGVGLLGALAAAWSRTAARFGAAFVALAAAYGAALVALTLPLFDRYALYLLPLICVGAAVGVGWLAGRLGRAGGVVLAALVLATAVATLPALKAAATGHVGVGSHSDPTYDGFPELCAWLKASPDVRIVWDRSLGWHLLSCLDGSRPSYYYGNASQIRVRGPYNGLALTAADDRGVVQDLRRRGVTVDLERVVTDQAGHPRLWLYHLKA